MITRKRFLQAQVDAVEELERKYPRKLFLISFVQPSPVRHKRFAAADARDARISMAMLGTPKGRVN